MTGWKDGALVWSQGWCPKWGGLQKAKASMKGMTLVLVLKRPAQTHQDHLHHPDPGGVVVVVVVVVVVEALLRLTGSWKHWGQVSEMLNQEQPEKRYEKKALGQPSGGN